jgi:adenylate kinase
MQTNAPKIDMIFIHGRPGGGKGTQVDTIKRTHPELTAFHPGDILRQAQNSSNPYYNRFNHYVQPYASLIASGAIAPPPEDFFHILTPLVRETLAEGNRQLLFDGFPRGIPYLRKFDDFVQTLKTEGNDVRMLHLYIVTSQTTGTIRISARRETEGRLDDGDEIIRRRMEAFRTETFPMLQELYDRGKLTVIRGDEAKDKKEITQDIEQRVNEFLSN